MTAFAGVCLLVLAVPFETRNPLLRVPGQELSSAELVLLAVIAAWLFSAIWSSAFALRASARPLRMLLPLRLPLTAPWLAFLAAMAVAAIASQFPSNSLHMTARLTLAFTVYLMTVNGVTNDERRHAVTIAIVAAGVLASLIVFLEYVGIGPVMRVLRLFRTDVALVGAQVRAGGPFQYPTIAAMYLEIAFALAVGLLPLAVDSARRTGLLAVVAATLVISQAVALTFTRAGLLAMACTLFIVGWRRYRQRGVDRAIHILAIIAVAIAVQLVMSRSVESLRLRLMTEGQETWYRADLYAPRELTMAARARITVPVTVTNTGGNTWDPWAAQPFRLSYHWLLDDADRVVSWEGLRTEFPSPIAPGDTIALHALVEAPRHPGRYRLLWDIEQEHRLWFSTEPNSTLMMSRATVTGAADMGPIPTTPLPRRAVRPRRLVLWRAAVLMFADRPLLGAGPDNYRLLYGDYAGITLADPRMHSNNMYLEVLAGAGVLGALAFAWLLWRSAKIAVMAAAGIAAACASIALHGVFDSFLSFTPTYVLISVTLGLASGVRRATDTA
jgi:hypothetical protein